MSVKSDVVKDTTVYYISTIVSQLICAVAHVLTFRFLGASKMGAWRLIRIYKDYLAYSSMGVTQGAGREMPFYRGKGEIEKSEEIRDVGMSFGLLASAVAGIGALLVALIFRSVLSKWIFLGLVLMPGMLILERIYNYYIIVLRAHKRFYLVSACSFLTSVALLVLVVTLVRWFDFLGIVIAVQLVALLGIIFLHLRTRYCTRFVLRRKWIGALMKIGLPLLACGFAFEILRSIDSIMIKTFLGENQLESLAKVGHYGIPVAASKFAYSFATTFNMVLFPRFQERYGETGDVQDLKGYTVKSMISLSWLLPMILGALLIVVPPMVRLILPQFVAGLPALKYLLLGTFFIAMVHPPGTLLITINKQMWIVPMLCVAIVLCAALNYVFISAGMDITGVAIGTTITFFVYWMSLTIFAVAQFARPGEMAVLFAKLLLPVAYFALVCWGVHFFFHGGSLVGDMALRLVVFAVLSVAPLWIVDKETGLLSTLWDVMRKSTGPPQ